MELTEEDIKQLKVAKVKCKKSLLFHTRYFFKERLKKKFIVAKHHELIAEKLEKVISGEITKLIINVAPRYSKTELCVKNLIAHCLSLNPSAKFIHLSYADDLALDNSEEIKDTVLSDEYQLIFPEVKLKKDSKSKKKWYTDQGGGVYATSSSGQVTGFGAGAVDEEEGDIDEFLTDIESKETFAGAIIIDDPIKPDDADSATIRDKVNNKFNSTIRNRVNSRKTPIIIIMQRLHEEDLCGHLIDKEGEEWEVLSLPSIKEDGTALWPHKHTLEELYKLRKLNTIVFDRQYMQDPQPLEGLILNPKKLNYFDKLNDNEGFEVSYIDGADDGTDHTSMPIARVINKKVYVYDALFSQKNLTVLEPRIIAKMESCKLDKTYIETNNAGGLFRRNIMQKTVLPTAPVKNTTNKLQRMHAEAGFIELNFCFLENPDNPEYIAFMKQACRVTLDGGGNQKDDALDSLAGLSRALRVMHSALFK